MLDQMTPAQRAAAIAQGKPADRLPCNPNIANDMCIRDSPEVIDPEKRDPWFQLNRDTLDKLPVVIEIQK